MGSRIEARWRSALVCTTAGWLALAPGALAVEAWDGRLQAAGFVETRIAAISEDLRGDYDLAQWANLVNLEIELDLAPQGLGPFSLLSGFARVLVQYDCVYSRGCGLLRSADAYGDRAHKLPDRLSDGERRSDNFTFSAELGVETPLALPDHRVGRFAEASEFADLFEQAPERASRLFRGFLDFGLIRPDDAAFEVTTALPWLPENFVKPIGALRHRANPFNPADVLDPDIGLMGGDALPFRPAPRFAAEGAAPEDAAQGVYLPNTGLRRHLDDIDPQDHDQSFRQAELAWNRAGSQQGEKELKELFLDFELFHAHFWGRVGKQTIIWGKTELFRNQDRWNPQDVSEGLLPSLEESRVALWAGRFVWLLYDVGPLRDFRIELATVLDPFEPLDTGVCGQPFVPVAACSIKAGLMNHGFTGRGIAGQSRPPDPWESSRGLEVGVRVEWRVKRFAFAVTDYWGYRDEFLTRSIFRYERNADPRTGRPRRNNSRGDCDPARGELAACLGVLRPDGGVDDGAAHRRDVLRNHSVNQQLFALICAGTAGSVLAATPACAQTAFGGSVAPIAASGLAGTPPAIGGVDPDTFVALEADSMDGGGGTLSSVLTDEQEALLGCGRFYGTDCDTQGFDLMNAEASALFQSFMGFEGTPRTGGRSDDPGLIQPGTFRIGAGGGLTPFAGGAVCTRFEEGRLFTLPGCRGPLDPGYAPGVDGGGSLAALVAAVRSGTPVGDPADFTGLVHPVSGDPFLTELAALSWNFQMLLVQLGSGPLSGGDVSDPSTFDPARPLAGDRCSIAVPQRCTAVHGFAQLTGLRRRSVSAGGNGGFGRRDFQWHAGTPFVLEYQKTNVLGFAMDFAEDRTATSWGVELTWDDDVLAMDADAVSGLSEVDRYNLTISVDRPTLVNFLNPHRSFFVNVQAFVAYVDGFRQSFPSDGPFTLLTTLSVMTGYFQDRLQPSATAVYDVESGSGGLLTGLRYRYTDQLSLTVGANLFFGRLQRVKAEVEPAELATDGRDPNRRRTGTNGLAAIRDLDHVYLQLRYSF